MAKAPAKRPTTKTVAKTVVAAPEIVTTIEPATLKQFSQSGAEGFTFTRYYWEGEGPREGVTPWIQKKLSPGDDPKFGACAKAEVLLSATTPSIYADLAFLIGHFDHELPRHERNAMVQVKLALDPEEPWHAGYEEVRAFARAHFVSQHLPVILVAHVPSVGGLNGYGPHVHCIVLSRPININGLLGANYRLCSDTGFAEALAAWQAWTAAEEEGA